jgi:FkbH-like protein
MIVVLVEWADLDPRLDIRASVRWSSDMSTDILAHATWRLAQLVQAINGLAKTGLQLAVAFPTLPFPDVSVSPPWRASSLEAELDARVAAAAASLISAQVALVSPSHLARISPMTTRFDAAVHLRTGFPYTLSHTDALTEALATLLQPPTPLKGLVVDLDNTMWSGIAGEIGPDNVSWDLAQGHHSHARFQQFLAALSQTGVLIGVASKNDPRVVSRVLGREDLLVPTERLFPVVASWRQKSEAIRDILSTWNIGPESVAFVDDSPLELAEVAHHYPQVACELFPSGDAEGIEQLISKLRRMFSKEVVTEEDHLRLSSIRRSTARSEAEKGVDPTGGFLGTVRGQISITEGTSNRDPRILELVNKTNQFNLNGTRYSPSQWTSRLGDPTRFLWVVSYEDKFGPLGKISVLSGQVEPSQAVVDTWVLSCRAFSRRIEHHTLRTLFERLKVGRVLVEALETDKNGPALEFLSTVAGSPAAEGGVTLEAEATLQWLGEAVHSIRWVASQ